MVLGWAWLASTAGAHVLNITRVRVAFDDSPTFRAEIAIDLTTLIGTGGAYYQMSILPPDQQAAAVNTLVPRVLEEIQFHFGGQRVVPVLKSWKIPAADRATYEDYYVGKMTVLSFEGTVPPGRPPFRLVTGDQGGVEYPLAYTCERPDRGVQRTRFLEIATQPSEPFDYDTARGEQAAAATVTPLPAGSTALPGADMSAAGRFWLVQVGTLWRYLRLGFDHIIPDGADHILSQHGRLVGVDPDADVGREPRDSALRQLLIPKGHQRANSRGGVPFRVGESRPDRELSPIGEFDQQRPQPPLVSPSARQVAQRPEPRRPETSLPSRASTTDPPRTSSRVGGASNPRRRALRRVLARS